ncbi:MAG: hypothetical protein MK323_14260, partial [Gammaproteobacteria bacterium]|nr:hypothetical protein [Gammaproteobacteria bacterium]
EMRSTKKPIQTGLRIDVKPISDKGMTEEEYRAKVAEIQKQRQQQEAIDKMAEARIKPKKPLPRLSNPPPRRPAPRYVKPMRGLLAPEPRSSPFMGLLAIPDTGGKK